MQRIGLLVAALIALSLTQVAFGDPAVKWKSIKQLRMAGIQRQTLDYSCGAASLAILLQQYFGESLKEEDLLADIVFRLSREDALDRATKGFSMLDLKRAAERLGYSADGVILPHEAITSLQGPIIILLRRRELNHFVVLKGASGGKAFLADPVRGHVRMPLHALFKEWQGEALILGREGFGLPTHHALAVPQGRAVAPEMQTVRALQ